MAHLGRRPRASGSVIDLSQLPSPSPSGSYHLNHSDSTLSIRMQKRRWSNFDTAPFEEGSGKRGSNSRPSAWEADALPTELLPQISMTKVGKVFEMTKWLGGDYFYYLRMRDYFFLKGFCKFASARGVERLMVGVDIGVYG